jgi:hypothetical protein
LKVARWGECLIEGSKAASATISMSDNRYYVNQSY